MGNHRTESALTGSALDTQQWKQVSAAHCEQGAVPRIDLGDDALNVTIRDGLAKVEDLLHSQLSVGEDFVTDKVLHLAAAGGKRFRPMFALLSSLYGPRSCSDDVCKAAVVVEMTHLATLYHDDVMDEADKRRGVQSANSRWNNSVAILAGDILLSHTSRLMGELGVETVMHFADTFGTLVTGQMRETVGPRGGNPVEHYMAVIEEKTGVLIASAGYLGALHSGADDDHRDALQRYGRAIGMVFQIVDDFIDIFSTPQESGKNPGTDLLEGVYTLPVLYALDEDSPVGDRLRELVQGRVDANHLPEVLSLLHQSTGRERALADVERYLAEAEAALVQLPDNTVTQALRTLARLTASRVG